MSSRALSRDAAARSRLLDTLMPSAGIAGSPDHASTAQELLRAADVALYAAKEAGRERVVLYEAA